ncbi:sigma factor, ECF subfamily protein [bacterium]|nr:sigma factor, ECF subfamily protein [bacterium]
MTEKIHLLVENLFRHQAGQVTATLSRIYGLEHLELIEDSVQETLLKALQIWPIKGVPKNPGGWIYASAKNLTVDKLRRESSVVTRSPDFDNLLEMQSFAGEEKEILLDAELKDDVLKMMFVCCHPAISREAQVSLTLNILGGFSVTEIAKAFFTQDTTVAQRLVRAKRKIRDEQLSLETPKNGELQKRVESVLEVLYLLFNKGYNAHEGESLIQEELCEEAVRLLTILSDHPGGRLPEVHALLALMYLQMSRFPARLDDNGDILLLSEQNRELWDRAMIQRGFYHLDLARRADALTEYHVQAGIAACHALAPSYERTDWRTITDYYDILQSINDSPVYALNRAVALAMSEGADAGLDALEGLAHLPTMRSYYLYYATLGELFARAGRNSDAAAAYRQALQTVQTEPEKNLLKKRLVQTSQ